MHSFCVNNLYIIQAALHVFKSVTCLAVLPMYYLILFSICKLSKVSKISHVFLIRLCGVLCYVDCCIFINRVAFMHVLVTSHTCCTSVTSVEYLF